MTQPASKPQRWFDAFRAYPSRTLDQSYTWRAWRPRASKLPNAEAHWRFLGPTNLLHDNLYGSPVTAGRVNAVLALESGTLYAGADRGGVWRSDDQGENWRPLTDSLPFPAITTLATDGTNLFAGTAHDAVLRSPDGGESWDFTPVPGRVTALQSTPEGLFVSVENGPLLRSRDGARTFESVLPVSGSLAFSANQLYVAAASGLWASSDGGSNWKAITPPNAVRPQRTFRIAANGATLYLLVSSTARLEGLYRSNDAGATWETVRTRFPENVCATINGPCPPLDLLAVDPLDAQTVYVGRVWLYRSRNGGETFEDISKSPRGVTAHVDHRALAFSPDGTRLYDANDGGIWTSATQGAPDWRHLNATLGITQFYPGMSLHPQDASQILAGTQDNSFVLWRDGVWKAGFTGDFMWTQIDPRNPSTAFAVLYPGREMVIRTRNNWADFAFLANGIDTERAPWVSPLEMDPNNPDALYFGTVRVFRTVNQGDRWQAISPELGAAITAITVAQGDSNRVYAAANNEIFAYRGGMNWEKLATPATRNVSRLIARGEEIYAAYSGLRAADGKGHVYYSPDAGATWIDRTAELPDCPVNDLLFDPRDTDVVYAATDLGVYRFSNGAWQLLGEGLPLTTVSSIRLHAPTRMLRAATYGRGIWELAVP